MTTLAETTAHGEESFVAPLSFSQERLWFLDQMDPGTPLYTMSGALRLSGDLDAPALERALGEVVRRHEVLRTTFRMKGGEAVQVIGPAGGVRMRMDDLSALPAGEREAEVRRRARAEAGTGFDLARGPLLRAGLLRLDAREHVLLLAMHHIVSDGWSMWVLFRELGELYGAFARGMPSPLPELELQYADFAEWQRAHLSGERMERLLDGWRRALHDAPALLDLPTDFPRPAVQSHRGGRHEVVLGRDRMERVRQLAGQRNATPFMVLLASFAALLSRHTASRDVVVGSSVANRTRREVEALVGFFVNTLPLRTDLSGDPPFTALVDRVRDVTLDAYAGQEVPFEKLVQDIHPDRTLSHNPLFQVMFVLQNVADAAPSLPGLEVELLKAEGGMSKFDLMLSVFDRGGEPGAALEYATDLFHPGTAVRLMERWVELLDGALAAPELRLSELPAMSPGERRMVVEEWNRTARAFPGAWTIHEAVSEQARRTPHATALLFEGETMTYAELERRANRVANRLRALGVGPEVRVGVCAERSLHTVAGLLGILKSGGAYVPVDPAYPPERIAFLLRDAGVAVVAAERVFRPLFRDEGVNLVLLDGEGAEEGSDTDPGVRVNPDNAAYVIYTSGSTGRPKGVVVPHRGVVNVLRWLDETYPFDGYERVLLKASLGFDASVWELFWPLTAGGSVVVARPGGHRDGEYLARLIAEQGVSTVHFIPSMLPAFLEAAGRLDAPRLKQVICGGEALSVELVERFHAQLPASLHNWYGPTETSIGTVDWAAVPGAALHTTPIGRPIANTRAYVLDEWLRPVPAGVAGELCMGGIGVARGYLGRPGLTAERFVPDPFAGDGGRLYRTGDRVRWRSDGEIEFLGRLDDQVKIRGLRIELGEIEAALLSHPAVRDGAVVVREDEPGDRRLVGYAVAAQGKRVTAGELRGHLARSLPEYMVPGALVFLDALPLTPTGKLDRKALPRPDGARPELGAGFVPPSTAAQREVAAIWGEVLGMERVGIDDPFFELGGHSLLLIRVRERVREHFGRQLPIADMFRYRTVRELAAHLAGEGAAEDAVVRQGRQGALRQIEAMNRRKRKLKARESRE